MSGTPKCNRLPDRLYFLCRPNKIPDYFLTDSDQDAVRTARYGNPDPGDVLWCVGRLGWYFDDDGSPVPVNNNVKKVVYVF